MTQLNYTSGNTADLVGGGTARMVDISGPFSDVKLFLNAGVLDFTDNIAASVVAPRRKSLRANVPIRIPSLVLSRHDRHYANEENYQLT